MSKKICKRCMKKQVTEDGKPHFVIATLEQEIGVCSFCDTENWVHSIPAGIEDMPDLGIEKPVVPSQKEQEVAESIPEPEIVEVVIQTGDNQFVTKEGKTVHGELIPEEPVEKSAQEEEIPKTDENAAKIAALRAKLAKLEAKE